jgi:hypothetical protein
MVCRALERLPRHEQTGNIPHAPLHPARPVRRGAGRAERAMKLDWVRGEITRIGVRSLLISGDDFDEGSLDELHSTVAFRKFSSFPVEPCHSCYRSRVQSGVNTV